MLATWWLTILPALQAATSLAITAAATHIAKGPSSGDTEASLDLLRQRSVVHAQLAVARHLSPDAELDLDSPVLLGLRGSTKNQCVRTLGDPFFCFSFPKHNLFWSFNQVDALRSWLDLTVPVDAWFLANPVGASGKHASFILFWGKQPEIEPI